MNLQAVPKQVELFIRQNSTAILTGVGVAGTITTAYLTGRATWKVSEDIHHGNEGCSALPKKALVKRYWKSYIPPVVAGGMTIGCIIGANRISNKRTAALAAAYSLSERAFTEYKEKVVEKLGDRKEQSVRDDIAQDKVTKAAVPADAVLYGTGTVMCFELHTGRPFLSDMETLKKAQNDVNWRILNHEYATLADFYHFVGLAATSSSHDYGWTVGRQLELEFSTTLSGENRPCIAFDYNYLKML
jgi:hypothetical protein